MGNANKRYSPREFFYDSSFSDYEPLKVVSFKKVLKTALSDYRKYFLNPVLLAALAMSC